MKTVTLYLQRVNLYANDENGTQLARLFDVSHNPQASRPYSQIDPRKIDGQCRNRAPYPWDEIAACHLKVLHFMDHGQYIEAFDTQKELVLTLQRTASTLARWSLPVIYVVNSDLRAIATTADIEARSLGQEDENQRKKLEDAANIISKSFSQCVTDRNMLSISKKYGTYRLIGILFRIYFKLKQQNLCKNVLRAIRVADMPDIAEFPKSDRVTYRYYLGRLYFLEEEYGKAEHELDLAFRECHNASHKNKELILQTLLPIRLMRGVLPSQSLLNKYPKTREIYGDLITAIRHGNIKQFNDTLVDKEQLLIRQGAYFAVEKAQSIAMRQLFRKVYLCMDRSTRIPMAQFKSALRFVGIDVSMEETEWMLANMIFKGYMKGYLSHEKLFVVLSAKDPFPKIAG